MYKFRINKITVNTSEGNKEIIPKSVNVIVGPNNSGKSRFLKELRDILSGDMKDIKIIDDIDFLFPDTFGNIDEAYDVKNKMVQDQYGNWMLKVYSNKSTQMFDMSMSLENYFTKNVNTISGNWKQYFEDVVSRRHKEEFFRYFGSLFFQYLGTEERLTICKSQRNYGLNSNNINYLSSFKFKNELLENLAVKVKSLFHKDIYLDTQTLGEQLVFRVGNNFDYIKDSSILSGNLAIRLFSEEMLDNQGDGLKSFVSTFLALNYIENDVLLLDEPEAFLHPPLARQLGELIGSFSCKESSIFVATHSVEILKGILSKCDDVNVIRITRNGNCDNDIMQLNQSILNSILQNPLLRVSRVLEGIFCEKVIITEAESDELVFQELIDKIKPESGLFFAHGQNKQTLVQIARLYQEIGVKYEIITDFDVMRVSHDLSNFLKLMPMEQSEREKIIKYADNLRSIIENSIDISGMADEEVEKHRKKIRDEVYHKIGINYFEPDMQQKINKTLNLLSGFHLHIIETGELETILEEFGLPYEDKKNWIVQALEKISGFQQEDITQQSKLFHFINKIINA